METTSFKLLIHNTDEMLEAAEWLVFNEETVALLRFHKDNNIGGLGDVLSFQQHQ